LCSATATGWSPRRIPASRSGATLIRFRAPDVAFVAAPRSERIPSRGYAELAPDIVAEVLSPDDAAAEVLAKVADWLAAGTKLVWLVDPQRSEARVYRPDGSLSILGSDQSLDGEDTLPGFRCSVSQIFA
jgi:Uma2 family endonuclease